MTQEDLEEKLKAKAAEIQSLQAQLQSPSISDDGQGASRSSSATLDFEIKKLQEDSQAEFQKTQQKVFSQFQKEIGPSWRTLAKEQKLQLVLPYQPGLVAYGTQAWMLAFTDEVAKRYDAKYRQRRHARRRQAAPSPPPPPRSSLSFCPWSRSRRRRAGCPPGRRASVPAARPSAGTGASRNWAMRSPRCRAKGAAPWLMSITATSPR